MHGSGRPITLEPQGVGAKLLQKTGAPMAIPIVAFVALFIFGLRGALIALIAGALVLLVLGLETIKAAFVWNEARLEIPQAVFELGATPTVRYLRDTKKPRDIGRCVVKCTLSCRETVTYRKGTDTERERTTVFSATFESPGVGTANGLEADIPIDIPVTGGSPSFELANNTVEWFIHTVVEGEGLPKDEQRFDVQVVPVLHKAPGRLQDS